MQLLSSLSVVIGLVALTHAAPQQMGRKAGNHHVRRNYETQVSYPHNGSYTVTGSSSSSGSTPLYTGTIPPYPYPTSCTTLNNSSSSSNNTIIYITVTQLQTSTTYISRNVTFYAPTSSRPFYANGSMTGAGSLSTSTTTTTQNLKYPSYAPSSLTTLSVTTASLTSITGDASSTPAYQVDTTCTEEETQTTSSGAPAYPTYTAPGYPTTTTLTSLSGTSTATTTSPATTTTTTTPTPLCDVHGLPVGDYYLAQFVEDRAGVPVSLSGCYEFCHGIYGISMGCESYDYYPQPGTGAPRCDLYAAGVEQALAALDDTLPNRWFDLACGVPTD